MRSPADVVLDLLYKVVVLVSDWLPRLPASWISFVNDGVESASGLVGGVPYADLMPWSVISGVAAGLPLVLVSAFAARMAMRVFGWVRSRGISDQ